MRQSKENFFNSPKSMNLDEICHQQEFTSTNFRHNTSGCTIQNASSFSDESGHGVKFPSSTGSQTRKRARKIDINEVKWSRKPIKESSKYSDYFERLFENGIESEFFVCKVCKEIPYYTNRSNYPSLKLHIARHGKDPDWRYNTSREESEKGNHRNIADEWPSSPKHLKIKSEKYKNHTRDINFNASSDNTAVEPEQFSWDEVIAGKKLELLDEQHVLTKMEHELRMQQSNAEHELRCQMMREEHEIKMRILRKQLDS